MIFSVIRVSLLESKLLFGNVIKAFNQSLNLTKTPLRSVLAG
ncbi:hypothetical protein [Methylomonas sp. CM2]